MINNISINCHSSIKINGEKIIYIDPYKIKEINKDADLIFITHEHYDHYSFEDINKIKKNNTRFIVPKSMKNRLIIDGISENDIISVDVKNKYNVDDIEFETIPAYNINKSFHPKNNNWVGYIININNIKYYIAGDTDITDEAINVKCDIAFIPIGGTYTMDYKEAATLTNKIKPKYAIPIHYGLIVGKYEDAIKYSNLLDKEIECKIIIN